MIQLAFGLHSRCIMTPQSSTVIWFSLNESQNDEAFEKQFALFGLDYSGVLIFANTPLPSLSCIVSTAAPPQPLPYHDLHTVHTTTSHS